MSELKKVFGPYKSTLFDHDLWSYNGIDFSLPRKRRRGRNSLPLIAELVNDVESYLAEILPLRGLICKYSRTVVEKVALKVFPDLLDNYLSKILVGIETLEEAKLSILGNEALVGDFHIRVRDSVTNFVYGDFERQVLQHLVKKNYPTENIMGYKVTFIEKTWTGGARWDVDGQYIATSRAVIKSSRELVEAIEQIKLCLTEIEPMTDLNSQFKGAFLSISARLFPKLLKKYLRTVMERSIAEGNHIVNYNRLIRLSVGTMKELTVYSDVFYEIVMEVNNELVDSEHEWRIDEYHLRLKGYGQNIGKIRKMGLWEINGIEVTVPQAMPPHEIVRYISEIKNKLLTKQPMGKTLKGYLLAFQQISLGLFRSETEEYLRHYGQCLTDVGEVLSLNKLFKLSFQVPTGNFEWIEEFKSFVDKIISSEYRKQQAIFLEQNKHVSFRDDVWKFYYVRGSSTKFRTINLTKILQVGIRNEVKHYFLNKLEYQDDYENVLKNFFSIVKVMSFFTRYSEIRYLSDIKQYQVESLLSYLQIEAKSHINSHLSVNEIANCIYSCKLLVEFIQGNAENVKVIPPKKNYFDYVHFHNLDSMKKSSKYIPEEIVHGLERHINELHVHFQRLLIIMLNTGMRFKEAVMLEENCIAPLGDDKEYAKLRYVPWKVLQARRNRGLGDYHTIIIEKRVADEIQAQIDETKDIRLVWGLKEIFITEFGYKASIHGSVSFCNAINKLIVKHDIKLLDGQPWKFKSKQCRKTVAVELITNGADPSEVTEYLGHLHDKTTNLYYNEVRKMKLADMNGEFYRKKFQTVIKPELLEKFSEEERRRLYVDFCLGYRERELGLCGKPYSEGACSKRTGRVNCAQCEKLCTGPQKLPKWIELRDAQQRYVNDLIHGYESEGISDYQDFREFQSEKHLLDIYQGAIDRIESFEERNKRGGG